MSIATKYAQLAAQAAPLIESGVNFISAAHSPTRKAAVNHCVTVLFTGLPSALRQADEV